MCIFFNIEYIGNIYIPTCHDQSESNFDSLLLLYLTVISQNKHE